MARYRVVGNWPIDEHPPGSVFDSDMSHARARRLYFAGHIEPVIEDEPIDGTEIELGEWGEISSSFGTELPLDGGWVGGSTDATDETPVVELAD